MLFELYKRVLRVDSWDYEAAKSVLRGRASLSCKLGEIELEAYEALTEEALRSLPPDRPSLTPRVGGFDPAPKAQGPGGALGRGCIRAR
jgi:hypothetical protein